VTEVSGRGVGLDVVRTTAARLSGEIGLRSEPGLGTTVSMEVPISLSSLTVLSVESRGDTVLVPLDGVRSTRWLGDDAIFDEAGSARLLYEGRAVPFVPLQRLLGAEGNEAKLQRAAVIIEYGGQRGAFGVDKLHGTLEVMVKPLPAAAGVHAAIAGAAFDSRGDPLLVVDPRSLVQAILAAPHSARVSVSEQKKLPILVIDDSLTTRMLEQSILESAGYEVDLASSAEEGLQRAENRRYGLFIVDVEMPGMNGYEFTAKTRADPTFSKIPVILVTSLSSPLARRRGIDAGASAYVVKGEFDQKQFVRKVAELLG
jgi:two-component system chemotaxis sensor kinase CheA